MRKYVTLVIAAFLGALIASPIAVYASHQFTDVPNGHTFHNAIDWMADNGITVGCNPPTNNRYCPDEAVSRGQMAAFMKRLAESQVVDAATVGGYGASGLAPRAAFNSIADAPDTGHTLSVDIEAPAAGQLLISGGINVFNSVGLDFIVCSLSIDGGVPVQGSFREIGIDSTEFEGECSTNGAITVGPGGHSVDFVVGGLGVNSGLLAGSMQALWVPFDGTGATPQP